MFNDYIELKNLNNNNFGKISVIYCFIEFINNIIIKK